MSGAKTMVLGLFVFCCMLFFSCNKSGKTLTWVYYNETYCSDPWTASNVNETLKDNCVAYFKKEGVEIYDIELFSDRDPESSASCVNKTGRRFKCKIKNRDLKKMQAFDFYE